VQIHVSSIHVHENIQKEKKKILWHAGSHVHKSKQQISTASTNQHAVSGCVEQHVPAIALRSTENQGFVAFEAKPRQNLSITYYLVHGHAHYVLLSHDQLKTNHL
jgi:hypothetical protein